MNKPVHKINLTKNSSSVKEQNNALLYNPLSKELSSFI